jgi:hypothetical protein
MIVSIYILLDIEGNVRYVGKSANPENRFRVHKNFFNWLYGFRIVEDDIPENRGNEREKFWIKVFRVQGCFLENGNDGGTGITPKTHCVHEHLYTEKNTFRRKDGKRICKACSEQGRLKSLERTRIKFAKQ